MNQKTKSKRSLMTSVKLCVGTDLDETMTPFIDYWVPAMRTVIPKLARKLSMKLGRLVTPDEVSFELGRIMMERGTHEWPWVWEESMFWMDPEYRKAWKNYKQFLKAIVIPYHQAIDSSREKNCRPYPNVKVALTSLRTHEKKVVIVSNGPDFSVFTKVKQNGFDKDVALVIAIEIGEPDASLGLTDEELAFGRARVAKGRAIKLDCFQVSIPKEWMKPDPRGLELAMRWVGATPENTVFIGDSLSNDGGAAQAARVAFLWAFYGTNQPEEYRKTIDEHFIAPKYRVKRARKLPPMLTKWGAATWAEILDHLEPAPLPLKPTVLNDSQHATASEGPGH